MKSETASSKPQPLERSLRLWNSSTSWNSILFSPSARAFEQDKLIYYILNEIGANKARLCHKVHFANYFPLHLCCLKSTSQVRLCASINQSQGRYLLFIDRFVTSCIDALSRWQSNNNIICDQMGSIENCG